MALWALGENPTSPLNQPFVGCLGTGIVARGVPRTRCPRVVGGESSRTSPSGSRTAIPSGSGKTKRPVSGTIGEGPSPPLGGTDEVPLAVTTLLGLLALCRICL